MPEAQHSLTDWDKLADSDGMDVAMESEMVMESWGPQFLTDITHKFMLRRARSMSSLTSYGGISVSEYGISTRPPPLKYTGATGRITSGGYLAEHFVIQSPSSSNLGSDEGPRVPAASVMEPQTSDSTSNSTHDGDVDYSNKDREKAMDDFHKPDSECFLKSDETWSHQQQLSSIRLAELNPRLKK